VLGALTGERTRQLLLARTSARYLGRLVAGLQQKRGQEAKFRRRAAPRDGTLTLILTYIPYYTLCHVVIAAALSGSATRQCAKRGRLAQACLRPGRRGEAVWRCCCRAWVWAGGCSVAPSGGVEQTPSGLPGVIASCDGETCSGPQAGRHVRTGGPGSQILDGPVNVLQAAIANSHVRKAAAASISGVHTRSPRTRAGWRLKWRRGARRRSAAWRPARPGWPRWWPPRRPPRRARRPASPRCSPAHGQCHGRDQQRAVGRVTRHAPSSAFCLALGVRCHIH